jgi:AIPR protein
MVSTKVRVKEARRIHDPNFPDAVEHIFTVDVLDLPKLPLGANPRAQNTNRRVYRDVAESLRNESGADNAFLGKNLGIFACAKKVEKAKGHEEEYVLEFSEGESVLEGLDGVLNGGHTAELIWANQQEIRDRRDRGRDIRQYVKLYVRQGYPRGVLAEMAGTLNTTLQVQAYSLAEHQDKFIWIHDIVDDKPYAHAIAFRENEKADYFVTDILSMLALFDTIGYPNAGGSHPTGAYREKSQILKRYLEDQKQFERLKPILHEILVLHDIIASEGAEKYNEYFRGGTNEPSRKKGRAADLAWVDAGAFTFPFTGTSSDKKLNRAAIYPALAAFRWMVDDDGPKVKWKGGFSAVRNIWDAAGPEMMKLTQDTSVENGRKTMAIGKSSTHYNSLHSAIAKHQLMGRVS